MTSDIVAAPDSNRSHERNWNLGNSDLLLEQEETGKHLRAILSET